MDIRRAKEEIKNCIEAYLMKDDHGEYAIPAMRQRPVFLEGPPGVGKTQIMEQIARECGVGLVAYTITHHTRQSAIGLPFIEKKEYGGQFYSVTEYTMSEIVASVYDYMERTGLREGILFIDEINCVSETLAPTMLQFLQYKTFGNHKIPDGWLIVTAGNPPEYNKSVREFDIATLDRIKKIEVEADFSVWKEYAYHSAIHPAVLSYLEARPDYFYCVETTVDGKRFATPRGWEDLARFLEIYEKLGKKVDRDVVYQYIEHPRIAKDFVGYLELYEKYRSDYQIDRILAGQRSEAMINGLSRAPFDEKLSVISLILAHLNSRFRELFNLEAYLEQLLGRLKTWQGEIRDGIGISQEGQQTIPAKLLTEQAAAAFEELKQRKNAGLLDRIEEYVRRDAAERLEKLAGVLKGERLTDPDAAVERVRGLFGEERERFELQSEEALSILEAAFDFLEAAFGDSQETVIFITELNANFYSVRFLEENRCERYYQYNKRLLFEEREDDIKQRLGRLGG